MVVFPLLDPQSLPGMAHLGPKSYPQVSSEKLKKNLTFILNLVSKKRVSVQKGCFFFQKLGCFTSLRPPGPICLKKKHFFTKQGCYTPPGLPIFAGHGSYWPRSLATSLLQGLEKKSNLH